MLGWSSLQWLVEQEKSKPLFVTVSVSIVQEVTSNNQLRYLFGYSVDRKRRKTQENKFQRKVAVG